jgi:hypothetical protein
MFFLVILNKIRWISTKILSLLWFILKLWDKNVLVQLNPHELWRIIDETLSAAKIF